MIQVLWLIAVGCRPAAIKGWPLCALLCLAAVQETTVID